MAVIFIKLQHILPIDGDLVNTNFVNISKSIQLDNKLDVQD